MSITCSELIQSLPNLLKLEQGNPKINISDVCPPENIKKDSILFITDEKKFLISIESQASTLVVPSAFSEKAKPHIKNKILLSSPNPTLAMAFTIEKFFSTKPKSKSELLHPSAQIDKTVKIGSHSRIEAFAQIGPNVKIGSNCHIHSHVVIEAGVEIGDGSIIYPFVYIGYNCKIGSHCEIKPHATIGSEGYGFAHDEKGRHHRIEQRGIVRIEDHVSIGAQCTIDRATFEETVIGEGTKLDNMIHVAHNSKIGKNCLFAGGTVIAGSTIIGDHVVMGGHSSIAGHIKICSGTQFGGRSAVIGDITSPGVYSGHPLQPIKSYLKTQVNLRNLNELLKSLRKKNNQEQQS